MNEPEHGHQHEAETHSGCGCASKAAPVGEAGGLMLRQSCPRPQRRRDKGPRSRLRHDGRSRDLKTPLRPRRRDLPFLLGRLPRQVRRRSRKVSRKGQDAPSPRCPRARSTPARCIRRSARSGPEAARSAAWRWSRRSRACDDRAQPRARRHDAAVLDRRRAGACRSSCWRWAAISSARHGWIDPTLSNWIQFVFATPVVLWAGWPFFVRGWQSLLTRNLNMFTLIAMGTGVAYVYSLVGTLAPQIFPADLPRPRRRGRGLFRGGGRHHRAGAARSGAGAARARCDVGRDQGAAGARAQDRAPRR